MDGRINASPEKGKILACESSLASVDGAGLGGYSWKFQFYLRAIQRSKIYLFDVMGRVNGRGQVIILYCLDKANCLDFGKWQQRWKEVERFKMYVGD